MQSKSDIISWLSSLTKTQTSRIENLGTGVDYCLVLHSTDPQFPVHLVNRMPKNELEYLKNLKLCQEYMSKHGVVSYFPVERIKKCRMQDNLEFVQWLYKFWCGKMEGKGGCLDKASDLNKRESSVEQKADLRNKIGKTEDCFVRREFNKQSERNCDAKIEADRLQKNEKDLIKESTLNSIKNTNLTNVYKENIKANYFRTPLSVSGLKSESRSSVIIKNENTDNIKEEKTNKITKSEEKKTDGRDNNKIENVNSNISHNIKDSRFINSSVYRNGALNTKEHKLNNNLPYKQNNNSLLNANLISKLERQIKNDKDLTKIKIDDGKENKIDPLCIGNEKKLYLNKQKIYDVHKNKSRENILETNRANKEINDAKNILEKEIKTDYKKTTLKMFGPSDVENISSNADVSYGKSSSLNYSQVRIGNTVIKNSNIEPLKNLNEKSNLGSYSKPTGKAPYVAANNYSKVDICSTDKLIEDYSNHSIITKSKDLQIKCFDCVHVKEKLDNLKVMNVDLQTKLIDLNEEVNVLKNKEKMFMEYKIKNREMDDEIAFYKDKISTLENEKKQYLQTADELRDLVEKEKEKLIIHLDNKYNIINGNLRKEYQQKIEQLSDIIEGFQTERDFYFTKLSAVEAFLKKAPLQDDIKETIANILYKNE